MSNYYHRVIGNLGMGEIAKSSDIHHIQRHIQDALKALLSDLHDGESYVLGSDEIYKNSFILKAAPKKEGSYIDSSNSDFNYTDSSVKTININYYDVRQPLLKTKTSLYSVKVAFRNKSNRDIPVVCELQDENGEPLRTNVITLTKNLDDEYEIIFDLNYYPTPPNLDYEALLARDGQDLPKDTDEEDYDEGFDESTHISQDDYDKNYFSSGVSKLYLVIKRTNLNQSDLVTNGDEDVVFDPNSSLGVFYKPGTDFPEKNIYVEVNSGNDKNGFSVYSGANGEDKGNLYYKDIYAKEMTYLCSGGNAVIAGEKVMCLDTHVSVEGGSSSGNTLTQIYLDSDGHLNAINRKSSFSTDIDSFEIDEDDVLPEEYLSIGLILTYSNALYNTSKEPLIIQDDYDQRPRSHHERLRRLEKQMNWSNDIAMPSRLKYTISDGDWVDTKGDNVIDIPFTVKKDSKGNDIKDSELLENNVFITPDENGNLVVQLSKEVPTTIPVTLKEKLTGKDGKPLKLAETNTLNISSFSTIEHMVHDSKKGTIELDKDKSKTDSKTQGISFTKEDAKATKYNLWDDSAQNRASGKEIEKHEREYKVVSGKNGEYDRDSYYPGMTFYTKTNCKLKKLTIPVHKFHNCSSVKFFIWKRQNSNNKKNTVWLQKLYKSKTFSLKKAKVRGKYQYMDEGFTINFGKGGLELPKGQYVIIALPVPKSGTGSLFVETYKPKNSKDFCIKYVGSANAAHFRLSERYQEVWYNSASAELEEQDFYKTGKVISNTVKFTGAGLERFTKVKPIIPSLKDGKNNSYELSVDTGGGWIKVTPNKNNTINKGGATTFKWKLEFKGDGKSSPKLSYDSKKDYAIKFVLTRAKPGNFMDLVSANDLQKNMCVTSKPFDGDEILRNYLGDMNFGLDESRFQGYEFARIWAEKIMNEKMLIDIQASDRKMDFNTTINSQEYKGKVDMWSMHYCDLTLDDFEKISVDYNDYTTELEHDENNMRLKLDSEHSLNDNDIHFINPNEFEKTKNEIDDSSDEDSGEGFLVTLKDKENVKENQLLAKKVFENPVDITKYTGLKFKFSLNTEELSSVVLKGLGIYISNTEEIDVPSNKKNLPENLNETPLSDADIIPPTIDPDESSYPYYENEIIQITHKIDPENDGNKIFKDGFYQYVKVYDENKGKYIYKRQQVFDLRSYSIYEIGDINTFNSKTKEFEVRIEIDQNSNNLKYVKEIGIISLNDEGKFSVKNEAIKTNLSAEISGSSIKITLKDKDDNPLTGQTIKIMGPPNLIQETTDNNGSITFGENLTSGVITAAFDGFSDDEKMYSPCSVKITYDLTENKNEISESDKTVIYSDEAELELTSIVALSQEVLTIYDPEEEVEFVTNLPNNVVTVQPKKSNSTTKELESNTLFSSSTYGDISGIQAKTGSNSNSIKLKTNPVTTQITIKHKDNGLREGDTLCYINNPFTGGLSQYKHMGIQLATDVYIPKDCLMVNICSEENGQNIIESVNLPTMNSIYYPTNSGTEINLSQVFKKLDLGDEQIKSISITITPFFKEALGKIITSSKPAINLFIGKIVLYRARTIPIYHNKMRFKFYSVSDGKIQHLNEDLDDETISIRKIGAVLDYD